MSFGDGLTLAFWGYIVLMAIALIGLFTLLALETYDRWREKKLEEKIGRRR